MTPSNVILLIDNYDSFVHNLARYFERLGQRTHVVRNDEVDVDTIRAWSPRGIVLSPGPCTPATAGCSIDVVQRLHDRVPILGVCLGHQAIAAAFGGKIVRAAEPMHGRTSLVGHAGTGLFAGLPSPFSACRYHSLIVDRSTIPAELEVVAATSGGEVMGLEHRSLPVFGVQFHPEAVLTDHGYPLLANFLERTGVAVGDTAPVAASELRRPRISSRPLPDLPVTF